MDSDCIFPALLVGHLNINYSNKALDVYYYKEKAAMHILSHWKGGLANGNFGWTPTLPLTHSPICHGWLHNIK